MKTALIFAHECAPYHRVASTAGAQRPAQFAKHLPAYGWRAVVLCCDVTHRERGTEDSFRRLPQLVADRLRAASPEESLVIATPSWPSDGLLDRSWRSLLPPGGADSPWRRALRRPLTAAKFITGDYSQPWQPFARRAAEAVAGETRIDACIGEHGPDAGLFLARWFSGRFRVPWIADFRDPILRFLRPLGRRLYLPRAQRLLATASAIVEVTPAWADLAAGEFGLPAHSIPNGFDPAEFECGADAAAPGDPFVIAYSGHIIVEQRPDVFFAALSRLRNDVPAAYGDVVFRYRGGAADEVRRLAEAHGVSDRVETAPHVERTQALGELCGADMLLLLSIAGGENDVYLRPGLYPAKAFEYFGARRPILCVPGDGGLLDDLIRTTRTGVICSTPERIAQTLVEAWRTWKAGRPLPYDPDVSVVAQYTRANASRRLAEVLDSVTGGGVRQCAPDHRSTRVEAGQLAG